MLHWSPLRLYTTTRTTRLGSALSAGIGVGVTDGEGVSLGVGVSDGVGVSEGVVVCEGVGVLVGAGGASEGVQLGLGVRVILGAGEKPCVGVRVGVDVGWIVPLGVPVNVTLAAAVGTLVEVAGEGGLVSVADGVFVAAGGFVGKPGERTRTTQVRATRMSTSSAHPANPPLRLSLALAGSAPVSLNLVAMPFRSGTGQLACLSPRDNPLGQFSKRQSRASLVRTANSYERTTRCACNLS